MWARACFLQVYISSTKSMMGHTLGAAGGLEAIVCAQVLRHGEIPPTMNLENPALEDGCDLNYCPGQKVRNACFAWCFVVFHNTLCRVSTPFVNILSATEPVSPWIGLPFCVRYVRAELLMRAR